MNAYFRKLFKSVEMAFDALASEQAVPVATRQRIIAAREVLLAKVQFSPEDNAKRYDLGKTFEETAHRFLTSLTVAQIATFAKTLTADEKTMLLSKLATVRTLMRWSERGSAFNSHQEALALVIADYGKERNGKDGGEATDDGQAESGGTKEPPKGSEGSQPHGQGEIEVLGAEGREGQGLQQDQGPSQEGSKEEHEASSDEASSDEAKEVDRLWRKGGDK